MKAIAAASAGPTVRWAVIALTAVAVAAGITAVWVAASWVDILDSTCGALYRPSIWRDKPFCRELMEGRLIAVLALTMLALVAAGAAALVWVVGRGPTDRLSARE